MSMHGSGCLHTETCVLIFKAGDSPRARNGRRAFRAWPCGEKDPNSPGDARMGCWHTSPCLSFFKAGDSPRARNAYRAFRASPCGEKYPNPPGDASGVLAHQSACGTFNSIQHYYGHLEIETVKRISVCEANTLTALLEKHDTVPRKQRSGV